MTTKEMLQDFPGRPNKSVSASRPERMTYARDMATISSRREALVLKISDDVALFKAERGGALAKVYDYIDARCHIAAATMKKVLLGQSIITREFLYKYTVGLDMPLEKAQAYFELQDGRLRDDSDWAEMIVFNALRDRDGVDSLKEQFQHLLGKKL